MVIVELHKAEVDYCLECHGLWLDEGEIDILLESPQAKTEFLQFLKGNPSSKETRRKCPICRKTMEKKLAGSTTLDQCSREHGIWFDRGELETVVKNNSSLDPKILHHLQELFGQKT